MWAQRLLQVLPQMLCCCLCRFCNFQPLAPLRLQPPSQGGEVAAEPFYSDPDCQRMFRHFIHTLMHRTNTLTGIMYRWVCGAGGQRCRCLVGKISTRRRPAGLLAVR